MISTLNEINSQGIFTIILCVVLVLLLIVEGTKLWKGTLESLDLKSGKELRENAVNERLDTLESELEKVKTTFLDNQETYHGQSIEIRNNLQENQENLSKQMAELKQLFINKEIDDMRWEMLDFASAIMNHRRCSKEQYDHPVTRLNLLIFLHPHIGHASPISSVYPQLVHISFGTFTAKYGISLSIA